MESIFLSLSVNSTFDAYDLGASYDAIGNVTGGIHYYSEALKVNSTDPFPLVNLGIDMYIQGNYTQSLNYFNKTLQVLQGNPQVLYDKSLTLGKLGLHSEAARLYALASKMDPSEIKVLHPHELLNTTKYWPSY